jgi:hypothetical protein
MDDPACLRGNIAVGVDMCHHIMPEPCFVRIGVLKVNIVKVRTQLGDLRIGHCKSKLMLRLCEC